MVFYPTPAVFYPFYPLRQFSTPPLYPFYPVAYPTFTPPQIEGVLSIINVPSTLASASLPVYNIPHRHPSELFGAEKSPSAFDIRRGICYNKSTKRGTADRRSALFNYSIK